MRAVGLLFIFLSTTAAGFIKAASYKESEKEIGAFIEMLYFIKHEIASFLTPQSKIYEKFTNRVLEKNGFLPLLKDVSAKGKESPLFLSIEECTTLRCGEEAVGIIKEFAETLGTLSVTEQCLRCDRAVSELEEIYKKKKAETAEKTGLCRSVGCMVGLGLVLLLW